ncbi:SLBB domain-containing protein [Frankia sp. AgB1.8]|uniref:SLBB domain-containing protein n=1 Tax=Frankia sp. AgB1.8 TaxID=2792839 RepID=UPI0019342B5D|nr:SLBB domain-containing protein [Frankia sp. AgB1.8]MBL7621089.1 SLBB domain-containing protein [Frankia sp. AgB1.8]
MTQMTVRPGDPLSGHRRDDLPARPEQPPRPTTGRLLDAGARDLDDHLARHGSVPWQGAPGRLLDELRAAGLTGRGGAGFPVWRKLAAAIPSSGRPRAGGQPSRAPIVIANAAEGEPESAKDAWLLATAPHLVLDGLALVVEAVAATDAHVYAKPGSGARSVTRALAERRAAKIDRRPPDLRLAPRSFIAGEASAVAAVIDGGQAAPFHQLVPLSAPASRGEGRTGRLRHPVVVCNAETLAHLALVARRGATWFRSTGTSDEPGTMLVTVSGAVRSPGVIEAPIGMTIGEIARLAGGATEPLGAARVGGYGGAWLPADRAHRVPMTRTGLATWDASPGPGLLHLLPAQACGLAETARITSYLAGQSAGQCGPCVHGLPELATATGRGGRPRPAPPPPPPPTKENRVLRVLFPPN